MAFDGSLKFDTKVNTDGFEKGTSSLSRATENVAKTAENAGRRVNEAFNKSTQISSLENQIEQTEQKIRDLSTALGEMKNADVPTEEYLELSKLVEKTQLKMDGLIDRQAKLEEQGVSKKSSRWKSLQYDIEETTRMLETYKAELQDTIDRDRAFTSGGDSASYAKKAEALENLNNKLYVQKQRISEVITKEGIAAKEAARLRDIGREAEVSNQEIADLSRRLQDLNARQKELQSAGAEFGHTEYDSNAAEISNVTARIKEYKRSLSEAATEAVRLSDIAKDAEVSNQEIANLNRQLQELTARQKELQAAGVGLGHTEYDSNTVEISNLTARIKEYKNSLSEAGEATSKFSLYMGMAAGYGKKLLGVVLQLGGSGFKRLGTFAKNAESNIMDIGKSFLFGKKQAGGFHRSLGGILKRLILFSIIRKIINGVATAFKEGTQNYAQYSSNFNSIMSSFVSTLDQLKNSVAAAFSPITSIVVPILDVLAQKLIYVINLIGQFLAALSGKGMFSNAVRINKDYADGLKKTGAAAKKAGSDAKKALAPFDELNMLQQQTNDSKSNGAGGVDPSQMFTESKIDSDISDFAGRIVKAFRAGDFAAIGQIIGEKINDEVQRFTDFISWDNAGAKITAFVTDFTDLFNSLVRTIDWYSIGVMMGTGTNTLVNTLYLLITQLDWGLIGEAFALGLNGTIDTIDWAKIGLLFAVGLGSLFTMASHFAETFDWTGFGSSIALSLSTFFQNFDWAGAGTAVSDIVIGLLDALITFVVETDWWAFGEGVATSLENIDWATVANRLFMAIGAVLGGIAAFLGGLISDGVEAAQIYFQGKIEECGGNVAKGILKGIGDALVGIGGWIKKNMFDPFINGFKDAFGIHSPSTVMAGMGKYLWDGFCNGIKEFFSNPTGFIKATITDPFVNGIKGLLGIHSPSTVLKEVGGNTVDGFNQGVENGQSNSQSIVQKWASGISNWFTSKLGLSGNNSDESKKWATGIISGYNSAISQDYTKSQSVMEAWADSIRKWFIGDGEGKGVNEAAWKKFADQIINAFKEKIQLGFIDSRAPMESWSNNLRTWFWGDSNYTGTGGLYNVFYMMAKRINEGFANGMSDFSNLTKAAMTKWAQGAIQEAKEGLDIHSPSRESYSIAEYFIQGFNNGISDMAKSSAGAVKSWLDGVKNVLDGANLQLSTGINIPNAAAYLPKMAQGVVVPPRAGEYQALKNSAEGNSFLEELASLIQQLKASNGQGSASGDSDINLNLFLDGAQIHHEVVKINKAVTDTVGINPLMG